MILIGQYDSPFVRRVAIALKLYGLEFEHRPWSVFGEGPAIARLNPLMRVPTLVLGDGFVLADSHMMLDFLDGQVETPLFPRAGMARVRALRVATLGTGLAEKAVALFYERRLHDVTSPAWEARCAAQVGQVLAALEAECPEAWWFGALGHADIAVACALRFLAEAHGMALPPRLAAFSARAEALPVFAATAQAFAAP